MMGHTNVFNTKFRKFGISAAEKSGNKGSRQKAGKTAKVGDISNQDTREFRIKSEGQYRKARTGLSFRSKANGKSFNRRATRGLRYPFDMNNFKLCTVQHSIRGHFGSCK